MKPLLILTGPTAVGKTSLSIALAKAVNGEIISADSMQVYRKMNIGSAKIKPEEMEGVPHHLIDVLDPAEKFDVVTFQHMAKEAMTGIWERNRIPILTGGTGFYIQSVLYDIDFTSHGGDPSFRHELEELARQKGPQFLHGLLTEKDPDAAAQIHPNNVKRVIRALEFYEQTGEQISVHNTEQKQRTSPYRSLYFVLNEPREILYRKIEQRIDKMMDEGLLEEVENLHREGYTKDMTSMQGLGYKELLSYLDGEVSLDEAVRILKRDTRHFAKRQLTWFRREKDVIWLQKEVFDFSGKKILDYMLALCRERNILK
ncbi:MAG: tRNA (adenosine(37)-N6)-dimethylallyltransferase MiaA [Ruminococcus sp.]|jgi:tRNA dimethylallyltransferase